MEGLLLFSIEPGAGREEILSLRDFQIDIQRPFL